MGHSRERIQPLIPLPSRSDCVKLTSRCGKRWETPFGRYGPTPRLSFLFFLYTGRRPFKLHAAIRAVFPSLTLFLLSPFLSNQNRGAHKCTDDIRHCFAQLLTRKKTHVCCSRMLYATKTTLSAE